VTPAPLASALRLPSALAASLEQQEPLPAEAVDADIIEDHLPEHTVFPPRTGLLPSASKSRDDSDGPSAFKDGVRQTPPPMERLSKEVFDGMLAEEAFVAVHERLFLHEKRKMRIGAPSCSQGGVTLAQLPLPPICFYPCLAVPGAIGCDSTLHEHLMPTLASGMNNPRFVEGPIPV
jgi:hypothetical protein